MAKATDKDISKKSSSKRLEAGIAGAGGGTLFILIAEVIPDKWGVKPILKYLSPSISIVLSVFWLWVKKKYNNYERSKRIELTFKQLTDFMNDPNISQIHKDLLRQKREQIQLAIVESKMVEVKKLYDQEG